MTKQRGYREFDLSGKKQFLQMFNDNKYCRETSQMP
jgi:hypothetical protein